MKFLPTLAFSLLLSPSSNAAISILIEPGLPGISHWSLTQTSASPGLAVSGLLGYLMGVDLPISMFNLTNATPGGGGTSDIMGPLPSSIGTAHEIYTNQNFSLNTLEISADLASYAVLKFDHLFTFGGSSALQFELASSTPLDLPLDISVYQPGVHSVQSVFWGNVTVTVIPEPSGTLLGGIGAGVLLRRRRA